MTQANDIVIVSGVRTAIGTFNGSLKHTHQHDLGAAVIREAIARAGIAPQDIDETIVGNVGQIAESGFIARICQLRAGIPQESTAYSVNRQCGSGLQALADGMMQLQSGQAEVVVACGTENMTQLPYYLRKARDGYRMGHGELEDGLISILTWPEGPYHNGITAENVAQRFGITREAMDDFAWSSQQKALKAIAEGRFREQILALEVPDGKKATRLFATDEHPRDTPREKLATLRPAFKADGVVTAANSSGINDGAAALVMMTRQQAEKRGLTPRMRIRGWAVAGCGAEIMGFGPSPATRRLMDRLNDGYRMGHGELEDGLISILTWPEGPYHNGITAENVAQRFGITREAMDDFAWSSQQKALKAIAEGRFREQILALEVPDGKKATRLFATDEHPRDTPREKLATLRPAFKADGVVTAANSSGINDGAAALVMMTRQQAEKRGLTPRMRIRGWAVAGCGAEIMGFGPSPATRRLMDRLNIDVQSIDLIELNEAFAAQALAVMNDLRLDPARVNVNGGAIALGHPVGASGAILPVKLMYEMARSGARTGLVTMCIGGGQGISMLFEREGA